MEQDFVKQEKTAQFDMKVALNVGVRKMLDEALSLAEENGSEQQQLMRQQSINNKLRS